jgi:hypothetical protein
MIFDMTFDNNKEEYQEIPVVLELKKNIAIVGRLISEYKYNGSFDKFASEEIRQAIVAIGPDYPEPIKEYANKLVEKEICRYLIVDIIIPYTSSFCSKSYRYDNERDNVTVTLSSIINKNKINKINNNNNKLKNQVNITVTISCLLLLHYLFSTL